MSKIKENLEQVKKHIPANVKIIAVSKSQPLEAIKEAYDAGQRIFGENRVQELVKKYEALPKDIEWHMIGHLQSNKVKQLVPFVSLIHSVDSLKLLKTINTCAGNYERVIDCLLQIHIALEDTKHGLTREEAHHLLQSETFKNMQNVRIVGLMGMATLTDDKAEISREYEQLEDFFLMLKQMYFYKKSYFKELSMGMSNDYHTAIGEGSTMIRLGTAIFGERKKKELQAQ